MMILQNPSQTPYMLYEHAARKSPKHFSCQLPSWSELEQQPVLQPGSPHIIILTLDNLITACIHFLTGWFISPLPAHKSQKAQQSSTPPKPSFPH